MFSFQRITMDPEKTAIDNIQYLVKKLTSSGKDILNEEQFKNLKNVCKKSDFYVGKLHEFLFKQFNKRHAEVRLSCFQICDGIFRKSHCFRLLVLKDFSNLVDLVLGKTDKEPMLKPVEASKKLKRIAIVTINEWHKKFGSSYDALPLGIEYMMKMKNVDFEEMTALSQQERIQQEEERRESERNKAKRIEKVTKVLEENSDLIKKDLTSFRNCFKLLIPDVKDFFIPSSNISDELLSQSTDVESATHLCAADENTEGNGIDEESSALYGSDYVRSTGILKGTSIKIDLSEIERVQETEDNHSVVENLKELINILTTVWLPKIKSIHQSIIPFTEGNTVLLKQIIDLKNAIDDAITSYTSVTIVPMSKKTTLLPIVPSQLIEEYDSDDDSDFIEVTDSDSRVSDALQSESELLGLLSNPASSKLTEWKSDFGAGTSRINPNVRLSEHFNSSASSLSSNNDGLINKVTKYSREQKSSRKLKNLTPESYEGKWQPPALHVNPLAGVGQVRLLYLLMIIYENF